MEAVVISKTLILMIEYGNIAKLNGIKSNIQQVISIRVNLYTYAYLSNIERMQL